PCVLALDRDAGRHVPQHHAGRDLVHVLPAFATRADEAFHQVVLADTERGEARHERSFLLGTHGEHRRHAGRYTTVTSHAAERCRKGVAKNRGPGVWRPPMWTRVRAFLFLALLTVAGSASAGTPISGFHESVFQGGLNGPTAIAFLPDGRLLITEQ